MMSQPDERTDATPNVSYALGEWVREEFPEITYLRRALQLAEEDGLGVARANVQRVEAFWSIDSGDWNALGFVLFMRDGARRYLSYFFAFDTNDESVEVESMGDEPYPADEDGKGRWIGEVRHLNRLLMS
jgi:hypothetical protein